ncbi:MAG: hypothetical protein AAF529_14565 [Pseudomonadota bacterium]
MGDLILCPAQVDASGHALSAVTANFAFDGDFSVGNRGGGFFWKISDGTETALQIALGVSTQRAVGILYVIEGPFSDLGVVGAATLEGADSGSVEFPPITTLGAARYVMGVGFMTDNGLYAGDSASFGMQAGREEGFTYLGSHLAPGGLGPFIVSASQVLATAGSLGGEAAPGAKILLSGSQAYPAGYDGIIAFYNSGGGGGDTTAPDWDGGGDPAVSAGPSSSSVSIQSTASDETDASVEKAFVVLADGAAAPASGEDVFNLTGNAASPVVSGNFTGGSAVANGSPSTFSPSGLSASTAYDYYEAIRDSSGNYRLSAVVNFTTTAAPPAGTNAANLFNTPLIR